MNKELIREAAVTIDIALQSAWALLKEAAFPPDHEDPGAVDDCKRNVMDGLEAINSLRAALMELDKDPEPVGQWIPTSERLPEEGERVLGRFTHGHTLITALSRQYLRSNGSNDGELMWMMGAMSGPQLFQAVTHWMPLPAPPKST